MNISYHKNLDGIRAIAALMVMVFHFFAEVAANTSLLARLKTLSVIGQTGVTLFFVLSGFLITRILISTRDSEGFFKNFYLRRALRIFPLYYLFLLIYYFVTPWIFNTAVIPFKEQLILYTYFQDFAVTFGWTADGPTHYWSLAVEEHFYLFWPLLIYFCSNKTLLRIVILIIISALVLRWIMIMHGYPVFYFTFTRFDSLAIGALLALLELRNIFTKENAIKFLLLLLAILIPTSLLWIVVTGSAQTSVQIYKDLLISFTYFALIGYVLSIRVNHIINKVLTSKFFLYTGKISYGLYVYHLLVFALSKMFLETGNWIVDLVISFGATYLVASISFYFFETPFLKMKKYFEYRSTN